MLGDTSFNFDFVVCKNLTRPLILGRDFLIQNHVHRKVDLQDAEITKEHQEAFKELCDEYKDIFATDSSDIGQHL